MRRYCHHDAGSRDMARSIATSLFVDHVQEAGRHSETGSKGRFWASSRETFARAFRSSLDSFLQSLDGRNASPSTIRAYGTDLRQFLTYLVETNSLLSHLVEVTQDDIHQYLAALGKQGRSGVTRARKLASIREFFKFLVTAKVVGVSPAEKVAIPKKEKRSRVYLRVDEYMRMLSAAGGNPRDFAILQLFLQTGIRVSELANLTLAHLDLQARTLHIPGKGQKARVIDLEKKAVQALVNYLRVSCHAPDEHLFLNYQEEGISDRGVKKIVEKYRLAAGI